MAKQNLAKPSVENKSNKPAPEPTFTRFGYIASLWLCVIGLAAQLVMAAMVYPKLPAMIPSWWVGQLVQTDVVPKWTIFAVFPFAQVVLIALTFFSPKDEQGGKVMESGKAWTITLLAALFIALEASAFHLVNG